ncbi:MAG: hypothetical protein ACT4OO_04025 [Nitrospiraceae bacterium]
MTANITKQQGFMSGKFHKSLKPESKFSFINVAIWETEDLYWKAYEKSAAPMKSKLEHLGAEMGPALYNVAFEYRFNLTSALHHGLERRVTRSTRRQVPSPHSAYL